MARERKKPEGSFIERAKNEDTLLTKRAYELGRIRGRKEQKKIDHSEEHLAWITQEFLKWRESNNPKVSFGEWINVSMEE